MTKCNIQTIIDFKRDKISVTDLCKSVGISRPVFYSYLKSEKEPSVSIAVKITDYLNDSLAQQGYSDDLYNITDFWTIE